MLVNNTKPFAIQLSYESCNIVQGDSFWHLFGYKLVLSEYIWGNNFEDISLVEL